MYGLFITHCTMEEEQRTPYYSVPKPLPAPAFEFKDPLEGIDHDASFALIAQSETRGPNVRSHYWKMLPDEERKAEKKKRKELSRARANEQKVNDAVRKRYFQATSNFYNISLLDWKWCQTQT